MLNDRSAAMSAMERAAASAVAMAAERPGAVPKQLAALWLLRVAYTLCGPMSASAAGSVHLRAAIEYWPDCLEENELRSVLEQCEECAKDEQCQREERLANEKYGGVDAP